MIKKRVYGAIIMIFLLCTMFSGSVVASATTKKTKVLTLENKSITVYVGDKETIGIKKNTTGSKPTYKSSNTKIATVSKKGVVTGKKKGKVTITVKAGSKTVKCTVNVKEKQLVLTEDTFTIKEGEKIKIRFEKDIDTKITYKSSNTKVATVSKYGNITGKKEGKTTITVKAGGETVKCSVIVKPKVSEVEKLEFKNDGFMVLDLGQTLDNSVKILPKNAVDTNIVYTSSDPSIVRVDENTGEITGLKPGDAFITATASNGIKAVCEVAVTSIPHKEIVNETLEEKDSTLIIKQGSVKLGQSVNEVIANLGKPNRIDDNEYGCQTYVYNSDYSSLLFVYVENEVVVGYYTNAAYFKCAGITNTLTMDEVNEISKNKAIWTIPNKYTISIWYDSLGSGSPMALFLTVPSFDQEWGAEDILLNASDSLVHNMELECFDLLNGFRGREGIHPVSFNSIASSVSRAHSKDMLERGYYDHISPDGLRSVHRLNNVGIYSSYIGEILTPCSPSGITYDFTTFMTSSGHRRIILDSAMLYAGPGIAYKETEKSNGYITIVFYN